MLIQDATLDVFWTYNIINIGYDIHRISHWKCAYDIVYDIVCLYYDIVCRHTIS